MAKKNKDSIVPNNLFYEDWHWPKNKDSIDFLNGYYILKPETYYHNPTIIYGAKTFKKALNERIGKQFIINVNREYITIEIKID